MIFLNFNFFFFIFFPYFFYPHVPFLFFLFFSPPHISLTSIFPFSFFFFLFFSSSTPLVLSSLFFFLFSFLLFVYSRAEDLSFFLSLSHKQILSYTHIDHRQRNGDQRSTQIDLHVFFFLFWFD